MHRMLEDLGSGGLLGDQVGPLVERWGFGAHAHMQRVPDAALLLTVMAGSDPKDPATKEADARRSLGEAWRLRQG